MSSERGLSILTRNARLVKFAMFSANFLASKATAFVAPLVMALTLPPETYGGIEVALSVALPVSLVLSIGVFSAFPQLTFRQRPVPMTDILALTVAVDSFVLIAAAGIAWLWGAADVVVLTLLVTVTVGVQMAAGIYCQTRSYRSLAAWLTSFSLISMAIVALLAAKFGSATKAELSSLLGVLALIVCCVFAGGYIRERRPEFRTRLAEVLRAGIPLISAGLVSLWIGNSPRIVLAIFFPLDVVALYAFDFRVAAIVLVFHQILTVGALAQLYTIKLRRFDHLGSIYIYMIAAALLVMVWLVPLVLSHLPLKAVPPASLATALALFPIVAVHVLVQLTSAGLELRLSRARRAGRAAAGNLIVATATVGAAVVLAKLGHLSIQTASVLFAVQLIASVMVQLYVLSQRGIILPRITTAMILTVALLGAHAVLR